MLTVIIATYNGEKTLPLVLDNYCKIALTDEEWKFIIVDNGSTDKTKDIIKSFLQLLPIKYLFEARRGKNAALNTAIPYIEGDITVLSDDDVLPHLNWLKEFRLAAETHKEYSIFGGPILAKWEVPPEDWILSWCPIKPTFAILDDIEREGPIENEMVFGPNMALRSNIFRMGYKFDEAIGPKGKKYAQGSETEMLMRLHRDGFKAWHCKNAIVSHMIRSFQMDKSWVLARAIRFGRGQYRLGWEYPKCDSTFCRIPKALFLRIVRGIYSIGKAYLIGNDEKIFRERWRLNYLFGIALEARLLNNERQNIFIQNSSL